MNVGTQDRRKVIAAATLTSLALFLIMRWLFPAEPSEYATGVVIAHAIAESPGQNKPYKNRKKSPEGSLDPVLRVAKLQLAESTPYDGNGRNIFADYDDCTIEPPVKKTPPDLTREIVQSTQPVAPAVRLRFFGFATKLDWPQKVFLLQDGDVFIGSEGDVVNRRYKIVRVGTTSIDIQDLIQNNINTLPLSPG
jgi:hypothetical protein